MRKHLTYANVAATMALVIAVAGGTAYAADTIGSNDVIDNSLGSVDLKNNAAVQGVDVRNGTLNDEDIAKGTFVDFPAVVGSVNAHSCIEKQITGVGAQGDHVLLTPSWQDSSADLTYAAEYRAAIEAVELHVCNPTDSVVDDGTSHLNMLVIEAQ